VQQIVPSPISPLKQMTAESIFSPLTADEAAPFSGAAAGPTSGIICLKPAHPAGNFLPNIDAANALLADRTLAAPRELVTGLLHAGTKGVLGGSSKAGKTWLLLDLAVSIATGTPFLRWPTTAGKVLFINLEIHRAFIKDRLHKITARKGLTDLSNLSIWTLRGQGADFDTLLEQIIERIQGERYALIILDPLYKLMVGRSENTAGSVGVLCHQIEQLIERTGAAVVYAHHFAKGNAAKKKAMDRLSGSGVFARDADTIITFTEHEEEGCYVVEITLRNLPPQPPFVVQWDVPVMVERRDLDPADLKRGGDEDLQEDDLEPLVELLEEKPLTTGEWQAAAERDGYSRATFYRMKQKLVAARRVTMDQTPTFWTRAGDDISQSQVSAVSKVETIETIETTETSETAETNTVCQAAPAPSASTEVSSLKSSSSLKPLSDLIPIRVAGVSCSIQRSGGAVMQEVPLRRISMHSDSAHDKSFRAWSRRPLRLAVNPLAAHGNNAKRHITEYYYEHIQRKIETSKGHARRAGGCERYKAVVEG
jgi:hypothetical protein